MGQDTAVETNLSTGGVSAILNDLNGASQTDAVSASPTGQTPDTHAVPASQPGELDPLDALASLTGEASADPKDATTPTEKTSDITLSEDEFRQHLSEMEKNLDEAIPIVSDQPPTTEEQPKEPPKKEPEAPAPDSGDVTELVPMQGFEITQEEIDAITVNGDVAALKGILTRQAQHVARSVAENISMNIPAVTLEVMASTFPLLSATTDFLDKYPEFENHPQLLMRAVGAARKENPKASRVQLVKIMEEKLDSALRRRQEILGNKPATIDLRPKAQTVAPGSGTQPRPTNPASQAGSNPTDSAWESMLNAAESGRRLRIR